MVSITVPALNGAGSIAGTLGILVLPVSLALAGLDLGGALVIAADVSAGHRVRLDAGGTLMVLDSPAGGTAWWGVA